MTLDFKIRLSICNLALLRIISGVSRNCNGWRARPDEVRFSNREAFQGENAGLCPYIETEGFFFGLNRLQHQGIISRPAWEGGAEERHALFEYEYKRL